jgi:putative SOS response-associated peptidase YedK
MCGRFTYKLTWPEIVKLYRVSLDTPARNTQPRYNICPTTSIDTVIGRGARVIVPMRWGVIPSWWSKSHKEMKLATFNARMETIREKPMFRRAFQRTRCLIPASGYYEWHDAPDGKQPYYFTRRDGAPITIAGLWDEWRDRQANETIRSCAMIMTDANEFVGELHDRMPVILEPEQFQAWLTGAAGLEILKPAANDVLQCWPVSRHVNSSRASDDDATLIERVTVGVSRGADQVLVQPTDTPR